jgi:thymidylate synthase
VKVFEADTGREAIFDAANYLLRHGKLVCPRGIETKELSPATFVIHKPWDVLPTGINRVKLHPAIGAAEALQGIAGISTPELLCRVAPNFKMFLNSTGQFDGAYGPRLFRSLEAAQKRLRDDPDTRQALATIWAEEDALREGSKDYPCTIMLHFLIRENALNLHVLMRSNDIWWGTPYDFFQFTQIQLTMANTLGLRPGTYVHTADSLHLYARDYEAAEALEWGVDLKPIHVGGLGTLDMSWHEVSHRAVSLLAGHTPRLMSSSEAWFAKTLSRYTNGKAT